MDVATITALSTAAVVVLGGIGTQAVRILKARGQAKKHEFAAREVERAAAVRERQLCEERNKELSAEIKEVRDRYETKFVDVLTTVAVETRAQSEVIRDNTNVQRQQTVVLDRICRLMAEQIPGRRADEKTPEPAPMLPRKDT